MNRSRAPLAVSFLLNAALAAALLLCSVFVAEAGERTVRVLVSEGRTALQVAGTGSFTVADASGRMILAQRRGGAGVRLGVHRNTVIVRDSGMYAPVAVVWPDPGALVQVEGRSYRGRVEVYPVSGGLSAVNVVELEDYVQGVIKDEIPPGWPAEAAKAMAVIARTYAAYQMEQQAGNLFHVRSTTASQMYGGATGEDPRTTWAVQVTRGQVLVFGGRPISAFYHSCSGGATEDASDIFGLNFDMIVGVEDPFSGACPHALWVQRLTARQIEEALRRAGHAVGRVTGFQDLVRSRTGRILQIAVQHSAGTLVLEGRRLREALGNEVIRSMDVEISADAQGFTFVGRGWGHGVGLSQWGAKEMADLAYSYRDILKFYYPLADIGRMGD
jgi:stage II sporulation protein D